MKDQFGNDMAVFVVSGVSDSGPGGPDTNVKVTLLLKSRLEMKKVEVTYSVNTEHRTISAVSKEREKFGHKWPFLEDVIFRVADGDKTVGKLFLREAMEAYGAKEKLNASQIEEVMMGVFLVTGVQDL